MNNRIYTKEELERIIKSCLQILREQDKYLLRTL